MEIQMSEFANYYAKANASYIDMLFQDCFFRMNKISARVKK